VAGPATVRPGRLSRGRGRTLARAGTTGKSPATRAGPDRNIEAYPSPGQMIDESEFRRVMGHFATGVAVVTSYRDDGSPIGLTVSAVASVSLEPRLMLVSVEREADSHRWIEGSAVFAVNVLEERKGETLARRFATGGLGDKFMGVAFHPEQTGAPVLDEALAWMDCRVTEVLPGGDHTIFLGEVVAADAREGTPLLYYRGGYGRFAS
jgi:flavin reductase (DIM6/NTAB) family NADH-FMN oxidoreductase RutF